MRKSEARWMAKNNYKNEAINNFSVCPKSVKQLTNYLLKIYQCD